MAVKRSWSLFNNQWMILSFVLFLMILMLVLVILQNRDSPVVSTRAQSQPQPQVIVIDKATTEDKSSYYPKNLPKYSSQDYQQMGMLTSNQTDKEPIILPLFGRKLYNRSDRWQYYTATDKNNMMRIPLQFDNRDCEDDVGCKEISNGDKISVEIYQGREFTATVYKTDAPHYFADKY